MVIKIHNSQHQHLYVINVYMPSSNYTVAEYDAVLSELYEFVMYCSDRGRAVVLGDMNGQIGPSGGSRCPMPQSHRGRRLLEFMHGHGLASLVAHPVCKGPVVTHTGYDDQSGTQIDHKCLHKSDISNVKKMFGSWGLRHQHVGSPCNYGNCQNRFTTFFTKRARCVQVGQRRYNAVQRHYKISECRNIGQWQRIKHWRNSEWNM